MHSGAAGLVRPGDCAYLMRRGDAKAKGRYNSDPEPAGQLTALRDIAERCRDTHSHLVFGAQGKVAMFVQIPDIWLPCQ